MGNWTAGKVNSCRSCGIEFWTPKAENAQQCGRCTRAKREKEAKIKHLTAKIRKWKADGSFHIGFAMIDLHWRNKLSLSECAKILGISEREAQFERDIVIENAK